jgi:hypothetical protein
MSVVTAQKRQEQGIAQSLTLDMQLMYRSRCVGFARASTNGRTRGDERKSKWWWVAGLVSRRCGQSKRGGNYLSWAVKRTVGARGRSGLGRLDWTGSEWRGRIVHGVNTGYSTVWGSLGRWGAVSGGQRGGTSECLRRYARSRSG